MAGVILASPGARRQDTSRPGRRAAPDEGDGGPEPVDPRRSRRRSRIDPGSIDAADATTPHLGPTRPYHRRPHADDDQSPPHPGHRRAEGPRRVRRRRAPRRLRHRGHLPVVVRCGAGPPRHRRAHLLRHLRLPAGAAVRRRGGRAHRLRLVPVVLVASGRAHLPGLLVRAHHAGARRRHRDRVDLPVLRLLRAVPDLRQGPRPQGHGAGLDPLHRDQLLRGAAVPRPGGAAPHPAPRAARGPAQGPARRLRRPVRAGRGLAPVPVHRRPAVGPGRPALAPGPDRLLRPRARRGRGGGGRPS